VEDEIKVVAVVTIVPRGQADRRMSQAVFPH
jgi:hypothetical protein